MKFVLRKSGNLYVRQKCKTNYKQISKTGVVSEFSDEREISYCNETCFVTKGKGKWSWIETDQGPLRWRQPAFYFRKNVWCGGNTSSSTFNGFSTAGTRLVGSALGPGQYDVNDISTAITLRYIDIGSLPGFFTLDQIAKTRALLKIKDQKVDLSTAAAELRSTVSMLAQASMSVYRMYRAVRKGDFIAFAKELKPGTIRRSPPKGWSSKDAASRWLEVQYGWLPLIGDIKGTVEWVNTSPAAQLTFRTTGSAVEQFSEALDIGTSNRPAISNITGKRVSKTVVHWQMEDYRKHRNAQGGLINPLVVAWELVPFSFVVDWFLPIGNWLATFDATQGTAFVSGTQTRFLEAEIRGRSSVRAYTPKSTVPQFYTSTEESPIYGGCLGLQRTVYSSYPFALPYFKNPLSTTHVANAIALSRNLRPR